MDGYVSIKRQPPMSALYDATPASDECYDHCVTMNAEDLQKLGVEMPDRGDMVHLNVMGRVVGVGDDHGHRYVRVEIEEVLFLENETTETPEEK